MFYKIVISLNMWFKRLGLCKSIKRKKLWTHEGTRRKKRLGTHEGPKVLKKREDEHMKVHKNK